MKQRKSCGMWLSENLILYRELLSSQYQEEEEEEEEGRRVLYLKRVKQLVTTFPPVGPQKSDKLKVRRQGRIQCAYFPHFETQNVKFWVNVGLNYNYKWINLMNQEVHKKCPLPLLQKSGSESGWELNSINVLHTTLML